MLPIKTAQQWGWSPSAIIRQAKNPRKAHPVDYALALAYSMVENEKCPQCGVPAYWAYSTDNSITFELTEVTCYGCAHKEEHKDDKKIDPGTTQVVRAIPEEGCVLPGRSEFIEAEMAKQQKANAA